MLCRFKHFAGILGFALSFAALAGTQAEGHSKGNGGYGYMSSSGFRLLDFYEAGLANKSDADLASSCSYSLEKIQQDLSAYTPSFLNDAELCLFYQKISELLEMRSLLGWALPRVLKLYSWHVADLGDTGLVDIHDIDSSVALEPSKVLLVANRRGRQILIDKTLFDRLSSYDRVGLVFHELLYSLIEPDITESDDGTALGRQSSVRARWLTSYIFSKNFSYRDQRDFEERLAGMPGYQQLLHISPLEQRSHRGRRVDYFSTGVPQRIRRDMIVLRAEYGYRLALTENDIGIVPIECENISTEWCPWIGFSHNSIFGTRFGTQYAFAEVAVEWSRFYSRGPGGSTVLVEKPLLALKRRHVLPNSLVTWDLNEITIRSPTQFVPPVERDTYQLMFDSYRIEIHSILARKWNLVSVFPF